MIVMVGNKAVVPKGRDAAHNRRKPTGGHRAAMPSGTNLEPWVTYAAGWVPGDVRVHLPPVQRVHHLPPRRLGMSHE